MKMEIKYAKICGCSKSSSQRAVTAVNAYIKKKQKNEVNGLNKFLIQKPRKRTTKSEENKKDVK